MLRLGAQRDSVSVVSDQWGNPTSALDIADGLLHIIRHIAGSPSFDQYGVYHLAGNGYTSWSGFAREIFAVSRALGGPLAEVNDIPTAEYPTRTPRPLNSRLSTRKLAEVFGWHAPAWQLSIREVLEGLIRID